MVEVKQAEVLMETVKTDSDAKGRDEEGEHVKIVVGSADSDEKMEVSVQRDATFRKVKKALAKLLRRDEVLDEVVLATKEYGVLLELEDYDPILDVRQVL